MATAEGSAPEYLLIGHLCRDIVDRHTRPGGTALYAGVTAARLGKRVGILTASADPVPTELDGVEVSRVDSAQTTVFEHLMTPRGRTLRLHARAAELTTQAIPVAWRDAPLVHLAPVANELPIDLGRAFPRSQVVATPQGWLGRERTDGRMERVEPPTDWLEDSRLSAVVLSIEDLEGSWERAEWLARVIPIVVVTAGAAGYTLYLDDGKKREYPALPAREVDATGAGDVFAATFFIRLSETADPVASARFAAAAAALSVASPGTAAIPTRAEVFGRLDQQPAA